MLITSPLWEEDVQREEPVALASADEAVRLAIDPPDKAQALAWAGTARLKIAIAGKTPDSTETLLREAESMLDEALQTYDQHALSWQWSDALGQLILRRVRIERDRPDAQKLIVKGCEHFKFAFENGPEHARPAIKAKWKTLYEMRK